MIKELLIFLILLRQFNTKESSDYLGVKKCIEEGGEVLSHGKVCIPRKHLEHMQWKPDYGSKTRIRITLSNVQVIEIGSNVITVSMNTKISWMEHRLKLGVDKAFLSVEDQKQVWSPRIVIGTNMVSKTKETEEIVVTELKEVSEKVRLAKKFYLSAKVKCE